MSDPENDGHVSDAAAPVDASDTTEQPRCRMTGTVESWLADERLRTVLAESPMAPAILAAQQGVRMPRLHPDAAHWAYTQDQYAVESLEVAIELDCPELVAQLLDLGATPDGLAIQVYDWAYTPAMHAATSRQWDLVFMLLDAGADPVRPAIANLDMTVLDMAALTAGPDIVRAVLDHVSERLEPHELTARDGPVAQATNWAKTPAVLDILLEFGVRPPVHALRFAVYRDVPPAVFEMLMDAARQHTYDDADIEPHSYDLCALRDKMAEPASTDDLIRRSDVEQLLTLLGEELSCADQ